MPVAPTSRAVADRLDDHGLAAGSDELDQLAAEWERRSASVRRLRAEADRSTGTGTFEARLGSCALRGAPPALGEPIRLAEGDPVEAVRLAVARATASQARLNAFVEVFADSAEREARDLRGGEELARAPLACLPFAYKDVFASPDRLPTCGVGLDHRWKGPPSRSLSRLRRAGCVPIGATGLDPHSFAATGLNPYFGRVRNPADPRFAAGGSSAGSAAAVAAGVVPFALGTDTGGSVRIPAALCGVFGFKPTHGLLQDDGVAPLSTSQDTVGVIGISPEVIAGVLGTLVSEGAGLHSPSRAGWRGLRVGIDPHGIGAGMQPDVAAAFASVLNAVEALKATVAVVPFPDIDDLNATAALLTGREAIAIHAEALARRPEWFAGVVRWRLLAAALITPDEYRLARELRARYLHQVLDTTYARCDVVLCPTVRVAGQRTDDWDEVDLARAGRLSLEYLSLNRPTSLLGLPVVSVPAGRDASGIPVAVQLVGAPFRDMSILSLARALSERLPAL